MIIELEHTKLFETMYDSWDYRYIINEGGTRSSKTWSRMEAYVEHAVNNKNTNEITQVFRKTLASCRRTVLRDFIEVLRRWKLFNHIKYNKTDSIFELFGNYIEFCGADDEQKLRGAKRDHLFINEANELSWDEAKQLFMRTNGQITLDYNPSFTDSWIYDFISMKSGMNATDIIEKCKANDGKFGVWSKEVIDEVEYDTGLLLTISTYKDNPFLGKHIIKEIEDLKKFNDDDYNIYALGIRSNPSGLMFKRTFYQHYDKLPNHKIGAIYCDPNLSLKGKGDTTAIVKIFYSPADNYFYVADVVCRSFSSPKDLLNEILRMYQDVRFLAFDGNFAQESAWTNNVESFSIINNMQFPVIEYKRYSVDNISKTTQYLWNDRQIFFNPEIENTEDGKRFMSQVFQFNGKKNTAKGVHDDAPDALICAVAYLHDLGIVSNGGANEILNRIIRKR